MYKLTRVADMVLDLSDGHPFPYNPTTDQQTNYEAQRYQAWLDAGNEPEPADPAPLQYTRGARLENRAQTTDASGTVVFQAELHPMTGYVGVLQLIAVDLGNGAVRAIRASIAAKRLNGDAVLIGSPVVIADHSDPSLAGTNISVTPFVRGFDFGIRVTGIAGRTIEWSVSGEFTSFSPQGR